MIAMEQKKSGFKFKKPTPRTVALIVADVFCYAVISITILAVGLGKDVGYSAAVIAVQTAVGVLCVQGCRMAAGVYRQVWRYPSTRAFMRLCLTDFAAGWLYYLIENFLLGSLKVGFTDALIIVALSLLSALGLRFVYQYFHEYAYFKPDAMGILAGFCGGAADSRRMPKTSVAIVGAGNVGVSLARDLLNNPYSTYAPSVFIDTDKDKIGREIMGIPVWPETQETPRLLSQMPVQEIVFALPQMDVERKKQLFTFYQVSGCRIKVYDYPMTRLAEGGRRQLREFSIEDLLFRKPITVNDEQTLSYYRDKVVLVTGGGGSIGSELCRQLARHAPRQLIILDVYENGAYDIQQEMRTLYGSALDIRVEIASVCDKAQVERIFARYRPEIVLHAAAHKHVPLMEHNCAEAVKNNVFGTLNVVEASEKYGIKKFIMISTDKAVNPTNVMGATKRMCEMIVLSRKGGETRFCATRFGNVLGSNGSVIPLFKKQIAAGGPVTLTDKRIIRYFMTIPEASQLVLHSGAMAKRGELYVLDMGKPVKVLDLAENMIRLSGLVPYQDIDIQEIGLRPGEKLYEELLIKTEGMDRTENSMIFVERDTPLSPEAISKKLALLRAAADSGDEESVVEALKEAVPTFKSPEQVNAAVHEWVDADAYLRQPAAG